MTAHTKNQIIYALTFMGEEQSGYQLACNTRAGAATLYPELLKLEDDGMIVSRWEEGSSPRRRLYSLSNQRQARKAGEKL